MGVGQQLLERGETRRIECVRHGHLLSPAIRIKLRAIGPWTLRARVHSSDVVEPSRAPPRFIGVVSTGADGADAAPRSPGLSAPGVTRPGGAGCSPCLMTMVSWLFFDA